MANEATSIWTNSAGDRITFSDGPDKRFTFGKSDFTIDFWGQNTNTSSPAVGWWSYAYDSNNRMHFTNYSHMEFYANVGGSSQNLSFANTRDLNWHHYAIVRTGNHLGIWIDGVLKATNYTFTLDLTYSSGNFFVGVRSDNSNHSSYSEEVYMDEFRVSHTARFGSIEAPTTQLKTWQAAGKGQNALLPHHTRLLIQANSSTTTSSSIIDETGNHTITVTNNVTHSAGNPLFGNTAIYFDGTDDKLTIGASPSHAVAASEDYSVEFWVYHSTSLSGQNNQYWINNDNDWAWKSYNHTSQDWFQLILDSTTIVQAPFNSAGGWTHAAVGRVNNVHCAWINGALAAANTATSGDNIDIAIPSSALYIGAMSGNAQDCHGYLDNIRICVGQSAYTPHFSPYGSQKNVTVSRGGAVTDARHPSANTHAIRMGQAAIGSTAATNANTYCLDFDGTADYLINNTASWRSADDRGTVFAWIYPDVNNAGQTVFAAGSSSAPNTYLIFSILDSGKLIIHQRENDTADQYYGNTTVSAAAWHSVAVVSSGTAWSLYLDGTAQSLTLDGTGSNAGEWFSDTASLSNIAIGATLKSSLSDEFNGKIMQVAYWGGSSGTTGVLDADAIAALHAAGKGYDIKGSGNTGNYDSWADDLKGYWRMGNHYLDSAGNITIHDASGYGYDMRGVSNPLAKTWTTGTNFLEGWQDRGYFSGDQHTALLIQSAHANGSTTFTDSGPGFKKTVFDGTDDVAVVSSLGSYRSSDTQGSINLWVKIKAGSAYQTLLWVGDSASSAYYLNFRITNSNQLQLVIQWDGTNHILFKTSWVDVIFGVWQMYTVTFDGTYKIYKNGVEVSTSFENTYGGNAWWFNSFSSTKANRISLGGGAQSPSTIHFFGGQMAAAGIWGGSSGTTGVLSASDILAIYELGPGGDWTTSYGTGLVDYWTFGNKITEGTDTASTIYSQVSGGNDLTTAGTMAVPYTGHTVTAAGGPYHSEARSVFGGSSIYFDGSDGKLSVPSSADWAYGTNDFTIDLWMHSTDATRYAGLFCNANGTGNSTEYLRLSQMSTGYIEFRMRQTTQGSDDNEVNVSSIAGDIKANVWHHIGAQRINGVMEVYVDGIWKNSAASTHNHTWGNSEGIEVGVRRESNWFQGYMDEIRFTTGIARYSKSIERYANTFVPKGDTGDAYTVLQIQSNGAKSGVGYSDGLNRTGYNASVGTITGQPRWMTTVGDPFGGANTALYFDGGSQINFGDHADFECGTATDFTFEFWFNISRLNSNGSWFFSKWTDGGGAAREYEVFVTAAGDKIIANINGATDVCNDVGPVSPDRWYHYILQRHSASIQVFRDGVMTNSTPNDTVGGSSSSFVIGNGSSGTLANTYKLIGYMDQFRMSKGIARYGGTSLRTTQQTVTSSNSDSQVVTANSTGGSGTNLFTADANTAVLLQGNSLTVDEASIPNVVTNNNGVTLRHGRSAFGANSYYFDGTNDYLSVASGQSPADSVDMLVTDTWRDNGFCAEMWIFPQTVSTQGVCQAIRVDGSNRIHMRFHNTHGFVVSFDSASGQVEILETNNDEFCKGFKDTWYHCAIQISNAPKKDQQELQLWINGKIFVSKTMGDKHFSAAGGVSCTFGYDASNYFHGYMDQIRVSNKERYTYAGTNVKHGLNAVHHSHCKLLITSNNANGDTHFDDFSDQGNYWNAQPYSIWSDGHLYAHGGTDTSGTNYFHTSYRVDNRTDKTFSYWVFPEYLSGDTDDYHLVGAQEGSAMLYLGFVGAGRAYTYVGTSSEIQGSNDDVIVGEWNLLTMVQDGTDVSAYVNGEVKASASSVGAGNDGTVDFGINSVASGRYKIPGRVSQVAVWHGKSLSASEILANWELGPDANWVEDTGPATYADKLAAYYTMGNHNNLGGRPADTTSKIYDRSGNGKDSSSGATTSINKGASITNNGIVRHSTALSNFGSSAIYFDGTNDYLSLTDSAIPNFGSRDWTIEGWIWPNDTSTHTFISKTASSTYGTVRVDFSQNQFITCYISYNSSSHVYISTPSWGIEDQTWHHIVIQRSGGNLEIHLNGILEASRKDLGTTALWDNTELWEIGRLDASNGYYWTGYMDEIAIYVGVAKYTELAIPGKATLTPSYLGDPSGNHLTALAGTGDGHVASDQMLDTPENNFCTLNPLTPADDNPWTSQTAAKVLTEGNLRAGKVGHAAYRSTIGMSSGKWYWEAFYENTNLNLGIISSQPPGGTSYSYNDASAYGVYPWDDQKITAGVWGGSDSFKGDPTDSGGGNSQNKMLCFAYDADNDKFWMGIDGSWNKQEERGAGRDPSKGLNPDFEPSVTYKPYVTWFHPASTSQDNNVDYNFGQGDKDGENNFTDSKERGGFRYQPPEGFLALCTANMKDEDYAPIGPTSTAGTPDKHFDTVLWKGDGAPTTVRGLNFQPDLVWIKPRGSGWSHKLYDSLRGATKRLEPDGTGAEGVETTGLTSFNSDGFSVNNQYHGTDTANNYVAWCWKAGNASVDNTDGNLVCKVSANKEAGFSIISYDNRSEGLTNFTLGHGLDKAPEFVIVKNRGKSSQWAIFHKDITAAYYLAFDTDAQANYSGYFPSGGMTATTIKLGTDDDVVGTTNGPNIAYAWHSVEGYSKFGFYEANSDADGPFVYTGFKPAMVMLKNMDGASTNWMMWDNKRGPYNPNGTILRGNTADAENAGTWKIDMVSNGYKIRTGGSDMINNTQTHVYIAFAEMPFKYATAK